MSTDHPLHAPGVRPMSSALATVALATLVAGFVAGRRYEHAARGWADLRARKAELPILRAAARLLSAKAAGVVLLAVLIAAWSLHILASQEP